MKCSFTLLSVSFFSLLSWGVTTRQPALPILDGQPYPYELGAIDEISLNADAPVKKLHTGPALFRMQKMKVARYLKRKNLDGLALQPVQGNTQNGSAEHMNNSL